MKLYIIKRLNFSNGKIFHYHAVYDDGKEYIHMILSFKLFNDEFNEYRQDYTLLECYHVDSLIEKSHVGVKEVIDKAVSEDGPDSIWELEGKCIEL